METHLYYNVPEGQKILHVMGEPQETRPIWLNNEQAVIAPEWSIHCAAGTSNYTFIWGMAGENLIYNDMQVVKIPYIGIIRYMIWQPGSWLTWARLCCLNNNLK